MYSVPGLSYPLSHINSFGESEVDESYTKGKFDIGIFERFTKSIKSRIDEFWDKLNTLKI